MASRCIIAKTSKLALAARTVLQRVDKLKLEDGDDFAVVLEGGQTLHGLQTIIAVVGAGYAHPELFGRDARERAHVNQWVGLATDVAAGSASVEDAEMLLPMNARHVANTAQATAADAFVYAAAVEGAAASPKSYPKLWKWAAGIEKDGLVAPIAAVIKPAPAVAPSADPKDTAAGAKWAKPNEAEIAARRAQKEQEKAEKERQKAAAAAAGGDAAPAAAAVARRRRAPLLLRRRQPRQTSRCRPTSWTCAWGSSPLLTSTPRPTGCSSRPSTWVSPRARARSSRASSRTTRLRTC
jgi:hypothetical protein